MQVDNVRKLHFQANLCEVFAEDKQLLWRFSFRVSSFAKDCLQPLVNRISIKTLERYWPSYILSYGSKLNDLTRNKRQLVHLTFFVVCHDKGDQQIQKIFIPTMQQCFHPSAKHLLYMQPTHGWRNYFQSWGHKCTSKECKTFL